PSIWPFDLEKVNNSDVAIDRRHSGIRHDLLPACHNTAVLAQVKNDFICLCSLWFGKALCESSKRRGAVNGGRLYLGKTFLLKKGISKYSPRGLYMEKYGILHVLQQSHREIENTTSLVFCNF